MYDTTITEVWYVLENDEEPYMPTLWRTQKDAQVYAKRMYPDESVAKRSSRIWFEKIMSYDDQYCADELDDELETDE